MTSIRPTRRRSGVPLASALLTCFLILIGGGMASAQTLVSDKDDYAPGEVAVLTGSGFQAGETVNLSISIDEPATGLHVADYQWAELTTADGTLTTEYIVPPEAAWMTLTAT